ncbi:hypothetical protein GCM10027292_19760 [Hydrogenophaga aquatica]
MPTTRSADVSRLRLVDQKALEGFDQLPGSANVRLPVVAALCGVSPVTVWRWSKSGRLPTPRRLSEGVTGWNVGELRRHIVKQA